jgi:hypothetical protein
MKKVTAASVARGALKYLDEATGEELNGHGMLEMRVTFRQILHCLKMEKTKAKGVGKLPTNATAARIAKSVFMPTGISDDMMRMMREDIVSVLQQYGKIQRMLGYHRGRIYSASKLDATQEKPVIWHRGSV